MSQQIPILRLKRSQPVQGKSVSLYFNDNEGKNLGMVLLPFDTWIKFQKLIQRGQESNAREQYPIQLKIVVEGYVPESLKKKTTKVSFSPQVENQEQSLGDPATPEQQAEAQEEEDAEEELQKVLAEEKAKEPTVEEKLIRTLKEGS